MPRRIAGGTCGVEQSRPVHIVHVINHNADGATALRQDHVHKGVPRTSRARAPSATHLAAAPPMIPVDRIVSATDSLWRAVHGPQADGRRVTEQ